MIMEFRQIEKCITEEASINQNRLLGNQPVVALRKLRIERNLTLVQTPTRSNELNDYLKLAQKIVSNMIRRNRKTA